MYLTARRTLGPLISGRATIAIENTSAVVNDRLDNSDCLLWNSKRRFGRGRVGRGRDNGIQQ